MLNLETLSLPDSDVEENLEELPSINVVEHDDVFGKFVVEPLPRGYGQTLGNPIRRVLYSSLPGTAVTWVKIEGILHEYATIPHVKEEVAEILMNIKSIRLRSNVDRPGKLRLEVSGQGEACAGDIMASTDYEIVNPELYLATLDSETARLSVEMNVERGTGYEQATEDQGLPIGVLPVDAIYTPVRKVKCTVEDMRVGQHTDLERLTIDIWTDGSITPVTAMRDAGEILVNNFFVFAKTRTLEEITPEGDAALKISPEQYNMAVEQLDLSSRTLNCLKRSSIDNVGQVLEQKQEDLLKIRNFGTKSLTELYNRLRELDFLPPELDPEHENSKDVDEVPVTSAESVQGEEE